MKITLSQPGATITIEVAPVTLEELSKLLTAIAAQVKFPTPNTITGIEVVPAPTS